MAHFLPLGGRFSRTQTANVIEEVMDNAMGKPGPGTYNPVMDKTFDRLPDGGRFMQSNSKSQLDWTIHNAAQLPGPGEYAPKNLSSDGGIVDTNRAKSSLDWVIYYAEQTPGPGAYQHTSMPMPEGGRFNISTSKSQLEQTVHDAKKMPGPGEYDFPRWPSPSHGRFSSPADVMGMVDHLHEYDPERDGPDDPGPRPAPSLDMYRDGTFRMSTKERGEATMKSLSSSIQPGGKKKQLVKYTTNKEFAQQRIAKAQSKGQGTAKEAISAIFDHLTKSKAKVVDVFKKIDVDGNGELDADEFRLAMQMLGLDLPRSQALAVLNEFDEDGNGTIDVEEFINRMRKLAGTRRAEMKAEAAIPDWIKEADKGKPPDRLDLGWRQMAPAKLPKPEPTMAELAVEHMRNNRPKSGGGTPFCAGGNGGRWRAGETSAMQGQPVDGWKATHSGWHYDPNSEFGGVGERLGASHLGSQSYSSLGNGTKHATRRIEAAQKLAAHRTHGNDRSKGVAEISVFQKSARTLSPTRAASSMQTSEEHGSWRAQTEARLLQTREKDLELYGVDGQTRVEGGTRPRGPTLTPAPCVEDASRILALSHGDEEGEWKAFQHPRFSEELADLENRTVVIPITSTGKYANTNTSKSRKPSEALAGHTRKMRSHRVSDKHPLMIRSTSPVKGQRFRGPNSSTTGVPLDRSSTMTTAGRLVGPGGRLSSGRSKRGPDSPTDLEKRFGLASGSGQFSVRA